MKKLGLLLLAATVGLVPAHADSVRVDLVISYLQPASALTPPPIFQGSNLSGTASFFQESTTSDLHNLSPVPPPIDIGNVAQGQSFETSFLIDTANFLFANQLDFSFNGLTNLNPNPPSIVPSFTAMAFSSFGDLPTSPSAPPILPIADLGSFLSPTPPPIEQSGRIVAFDGPVVVGTWTVTVSTVTVSAVPEPSTLPLVAFGLLFFGRAIKRPLTGTPEQPPARRG